MYLGWFCFGGNEVINNPRTVAYARTAGCPVNWFVGDDDDDSRALIQMTEGAEDGLDLPLYSYDVINDAPWAAPTSDNEYFGSRSFLGAYCLDAQGLPDSTRSAESKQRTGNGAIIARERYGSRRVRFRVLLTALDEDGIDFGSSWLDTVLAEQSCQTHLGGSCGTSDMTFFQSLNGTWEFNDEFGAGMYDMEVDRKTRRLHGCKVISGPLVQRELESNLSSARGRIVEFTVEAEQPFLYGIPFPVTSPSTGGTQRIQDSPVNLIPAPNGRVATVAGVIMTNYCLNPSVEVDVSGWSTLMSGSILSGSVISRSTEQFRYGVASARARFTSPAASAVIGYVGVENLVALPTYVAGARWSISMWAKANVESGTIALNDIIIEAIWRTAANVVLRTDTLGTVPITGGELSASGLVRPPTATNVIVRARLPIPSRASGAIARLYGDAISVTTP